LRNGQTSGCLTDSRPSPIVFFITRNGPLTIFARLDYDLHKNDNRYHKMANASAYDLPLSSNARSGRNAFMQPSFDISLADKYFHITAGGSEHPVFSIPAAQLLLPDTMDELLRRGRDMLNGLGLDIAVSFLGLAFFGIPAAVHTFMWQYDHILRSSRS
jgi:hypothetical protein